MQIRENETAAYFKFCAVFSSFKPLYIPIVVFTSHVPVFFCSSSYNFGDKELKFCILL